MCDSNTMTAAKTGPAASLSFFFNCFFFFVCADAGLEPVLAWIPLLALGWETPVPSQRPFAQKYTPLCTAGTEILR